MVEKTVSSSFWVQSTEVVGSRLLSTFIWVHSQYKFLIQPNFPVLPVSLSRSQAELLSQYITRAFRALSFCQLHYFTENTFSYPASTLQPCSSAEVDPKCHCFTESYFSLPNNVLSHKAISVGHLSTFISERVKIIWVKLEKVVSMTRKYIL